MRLTALVFLTLPFALVGAIAAAFLTGGVLSLGSLVGLVTVIGIAARNGIMLVSHYRHMQLEEGMPFGRDLVLRGAEERLAPILMTALATGLALVPIALSGDKAGHEIEHPMAVVILGGLVTSTLLEPVPAAAAVPAIRPAGARRGPARVYEALMAVASDLPCGSRRVPGAPAAHEGMESAQDHSHGAAARPQVEPWIVAISRGRQDQASRPRAARRYGHPL